MDQDQPLRPDWARLADRARELRDAAQARADAGGPTAWMAQINAGTLGRLHARILSRIPPAAPKGPGN